MARIIVNADDFGMSASVNRAIVAAFAQGCVSTTSLMANMPGTQEAGALARDHGFANRIGIHLNLSEGVPLTMPITACPRFCVDGRFRGRRSAFRLSARERSAVDAELTRQVEVCLALGITPTHLDSHQHYHDEWSVGAATIRIARRFAVGAVRVSRNCGPGIDWLRRVYKTLLNTRLARHRLARSRYFGSAADVAPLLPRLDGDVEIMVHPRFSPAGIVSDLEDGEPLGTVIARLGVRMDAPGGSQ
jgi:predicted glycoside hydrolase/deacetylase ChbG (UPF0249 family)